MLKLSIQSVIDVSRLLAALEDWRPLRGERGALLILAEQGIIPGNLAERLLKAKGFRNVLAHDSMETDPDLLVARLRDDTDDLWAFAKNVAQHLAAKGREK